MRYESCFWVPWQKDLTMLVPCIQTGLRDRPSGVSTRAIFPLGSEKLLGSSLCCGLLGTGAALGLLSGLLVLAVNVSLVVT